MGVLTDLSERRTGSVILRVYRAFVGRDPRREVLLFQPSNPWQTRYRTSRALLPPFSLARQGPVLRRSVASFPFVVVVTHQGSIHASSPLAHRLLPLRR